MINEMAMAGVIIGLLLMVIGLLSHILWEHNRCPRCGRIHLTMKDKVDCWMKR